MARRTWLRRVAIGAAALYALVNLALILLVPLLHPLRAEVRIRSSAGVPVEGALVSWIDLKGGKPLGSKALSDPGGIARTWVTFQEPPLWVFPTLGHYSYRNLGISVEHSDFDGERIAIADFDSKLHLGEPAVRIDVMLDRRTDTQR